MERKLRFLNNELQKVGIEVQSSSGVEAPDSQGMRLGLSLSAHHEVWG